MPSLPLDETLAPKSNVSAPDECSSSAAWLIAGTRSSSSKSGGSIARRFGPTARKIPVGGASARAFCGGARGEAILAAARGVGVAAHLVGRLGLDRLDRP